MMGYSGLLPRLAVIDEFPSDLEQRRKFMLKLAKALLTYGAPSHRIESQLSAASEILGAHAGYFVLRRDTRPA
jgi:uncharacterized membrane protein YjjP (DUF1212 family)